MNNIKSLCLKCLVIGTSLAAAAAAATCGSGGGTNISNSGTTVCTLDGLTFTFDTPGFTPNSSGDALTITSAAVSGSDYVLEFGINPGTSGFPADINIDYLVTSSSNNIDGIDASFPGGTSGSISEQACSVSTFGNPCPGPDTLASVHVTAGGVSPVATFGPVSSVYIHKDIDAINFSEFTDSIQVSAVPEPSSALLLFSACGVLGVVSRKLCRNS